MPRHTHTLATMEVPAEVFDTVRRMLVEADYGHAVLAERGEAERLDMTGIALEAAAAPMEAFARSCIVYPQRPCPGGCAGLQSGPDGMSAPCLRQPAPILLAPNPTVTLSADAFRVLWDQHATEPGVLVEAQDDDMVAAEAHALALDAVYTERNKMVALVARLFPSGIKRTAIEGWDPAWHNCVYVDLPQGQASWHYHDRDAWLFESLPPYTGEWDGHTTESKYAGIVALARSLG